MKAMRPTYLTMKSCVSAAIGLALGVSLLTVSAPARADDDDVPIDTKVIRTILESLGLKSADGAAIDYQERPPLVLPSNDKLPPPVKSDAVANDPAWPKDPDVARAKFEKSLEKNKGTTSEEVRHESRPLSPSELTPGAKYARRTRNPSLPDAAGADGSEMTPSQLGYTGGLFKKMFGKDDKDIAKFTGEPQRSSLTQPPPGYQTPSPDQPYGAGKGGPPKPNNDYLTRGEAR
jgi:hypothetical protein